MNLYDIAEQYKRDLEALADLDLPAEVVADTLESMGGELQVKAQNVALFIRNLDSFQEAIEQEVIRLSVKQAKLKARAEHLNAYLKTCMELAGVSKIETPLVNLTIKANPPSVEVFQRELIPAMYFKQTEPPAPKLSLTDIKTAIKAGADVPGAKLITDKTRLEIK